MGFNCGIVGLPNVGKSTLFNALTKTAAAESANYPFCTIEPNVGRVSVPDERLTKIAEIFSSQSVIPTTLEVVDIAGLVKGASKGEGLGNQFLGHIRQVDAIIHVLRSFESNDITHVEETVDPIRDKEIIDTELMLADLESIERQILQLQKRIKAQDKEAKELLEVATKVAENLKDGIPLRKISFSDDELNLVHTFNLITQKPVLYVCNVDERALNTGNTFTESVRKMAEEESAKIVLICASIESEIASLPEEDQKAFLDDLGITEPGLNQVISEGYSLLNLITFFTAGPKEARAWTVEKDSTAPQAAGKIHTDFQRGFICAETLAYDDLIEAGSESAAKERGKLRQEGKDYIVKDGDVFHFRFNV